MSCAIGSHHAAGYHSSDDKKAGWWDTFIGPGKAIDTTRFCGGVLTTLAAATARPVQPVPTQKPASRMVQIFLSHYQRLGKTQVMLSDYLGIDIWHAIVGGSMGGMQAMQWSIDYPSRFKNAWSLPARRSCLRKISPLTRWHANRFYPILILRRTLYRAGQNPQTRFDFGAYGRSYHLSHR